MQNSAEATFAVPFSQVQISATLTSIGLTCAKPIFGTRI